MSKIYEALEKAKQEKRAGERLDLVPVMDRVRKSPGGLVVLNDPYSHMAECFRFLRYKVIRPPSGVPPRTILVTSALMGEGKTFVACNLAVSISQSLEEQVLLIDADLRSPGVHEVFGLRAYREGLSTYLAGQLPLPEVLRKTEIPKLSILPAGNSTVIPAELLSSARMKGLIREVRDRYADRFVIIDTSPLELTSETAVLVHEVDAVILVVRHGQTPRDAVKSAVGKIQKKKLLGIVYNGYDEPLKGYGKYAGYYKGYGYGNREK
ncbi:MAG: polysaccharide biosynthesis tyrosine autokinase [Deltaproteobacteria bacterium]|nr:polysaccharide biosynthesis tyrosine autokinase [Deltaproteobacteria bacterium]